MAATGAGFTLVHGFWPLLIVAFVGTLNPSSGDVSVFLPLEQSVLTQTVSARQRTALFARNSLVGSLVAAAGALCAGVPELIATRGGFPVSTALQGMFVLYGALGLIALGLYNRLSVSLGLSTFGWPLVIAGALKAIYDVLMLAMFAKVRPPEEAD